MGTAVLGKGALQLESLTNPGEVLVLPLTPVASLPAGLTTQLAAIAGASIYAGWRLHVYVLGNSASGTISVAGKDFSQAQNAITETTPTIPIAGTGTNLLSSGYEFTTNNIYSVVTAATGISVSGLTGGSVKIFAIMAPRSLQPMMFEAEEKIPPFSPVEQRGVRSRHTAIQRLNKAVDIGKLDQIFLPDSVNWWFPRMAIGSAPTQATVPATPTVLKAVTTIVSFPASLTTQPNTLGPGQLIQLVVTASSVVGTITIAGTNIYGQAITEVVQCGAPGAANGNGTFYTQQVFATVNTNGVSATGLTSGSVAINGLTATQETYTRSTAGAGDSLQSASVEWFDGTDTVVLPYCFLTETTIAGNPDNKEITIAGKGMAQNMLTVGDRTVTPMIANARASQIGAVGAFAGSVGSPSTPAAGLWQPFDVGLSGWQSAVYIDPLSGTAGTTLFASGGVGTVLDWKIIFKTPQKPSYPAVNSQLYQKVYLQQDETEIDLIIDFQDVIQYEMFRQNVKQFLQIQIIGPYLGTTGGIIYNKKWIFTFGAKIIEAKRDASKMEKVEATVKFMAEYDVTLGYEYQLVTTNTIPPNYAS